MKIMLRRLSVPFLVLAMGALSQGCSSSSGGGGTGGVVGTDGGSAGGHLGTGGSSVGGATGAGGATAAGGSPGTDAAADAPRDTASDSPAPTDASLNLAELCPRQPDGGPAIRMMYSPAMTPTEFCTLYLQTCGGTNNPDGGPTTLSACMATYTGLTYETTRECRSDHVCNAAVYFPGAVALHCGHANGNPPCADVVVDSGTAPTDASGN
jgi:hypothetical protein